MLDIVRSPEGFLKRQVRKKGRVGPICVHNQQTNSIVSESELANRERLNAHLKFELDPHGTHADRDNLSEARSQNPFERAHIGQWQLCDLIQQSRQASTALQRILTRSLRRWTDPVVVLRATSAHSFFLNGSWFLCHGWPRISWS